MEVSQTLEKALEDQNISAIHSVFYAIAHEDPNFISGKFYDTLNYVKGKNVAGVMETYDQKPFAPRNEWNEEYWAEVASDLVDNFCEERITHLAEVGKAVYPPSDRSLSDSYEVTNQPQKKTEPVQDLSAIQQKSGMKKYIGIGILAVIVIIILILLF